MTISYKRLWKLLIDRELKKCQLREMAHISQTTMAKLSKNQNVTTDILIKICDALNCDLSEIVEVVK